MTGEGQIMSKDRTKVIASYLARIQQSGLQIQEFFEKYAVPFGVAQYYRYKKRFERDGLQGLQDGRAQGNHRYAAADRRSADRTRERDHRGGQGGVGSDAARARRGHRGQGDRSDRRRLAAVESRSGAARRDGSPGVDCG